MGAFCALFIISLILQVDGSVNLLKKGGDCPEADYVFQQAEAIGMMVARLNMPGEDPSVNTHAFLSTKIRTLTYNSYLNITYFVSNERPNNIYGIGNSMQIHLFLKIKEADFENIALDPVTKNLYFLDKSGKIGVCSTRKPRVLCTWLIAETNKSVIYHTLTFNARKGTMSWLETDDHHRYIKEASMNGQNIRILSQLDLQSGERVDSPKPHTYVSNFDTEINKFVVQNESSAETVDFEVDQTFILVCRDGSAESQEELSVDFSHDLRIDGDSARFTKIVVAKNQAHKENPCDLSECDGVCTLTEAQPKPTSVCFCDKCETISAATTTMQPEITFEVQEESTNVEPTTQPSVQPSTTSKVNEMKRELSSLEKEVQKLETEAQINSVIMALFFILFGIASLALVFWLGKKLYGRISRNLSNDSSTQSSQSSISLAPIFNYGTANVV